MASLKDMLRKLSEHDLRTVGFREGDTAFLSYAFTKHPAFEDEN